LDLLINNAGIMHPPKTLSAQGYEIQFAVNHLAHMLLTLKLLPIIEKKGTDILLLSFEQKIINISNHDLITNESRVKAYILKDCPWSKRAIRLLNSLSIPHEVTLIDNDESFQKIMTQSSHNTFPQIFLDNKFFGGYDELSEQAKLDNLISFK